MFIHDESLGLIHQHVCQSVISFFLRRAKKKKEERKERKNKECKQLCLYLHATGEAP